MKRFCYCKSGVCLCSKLPPKSHLVVRIHALWVLDAENLVHSKTLISQFLRPSVRTLSQSVANV